MTFLKAISVVLIFASSICSNAQFLTPDQLREQHDIGFGARTHYEMSGSRLTDMFRRVNPDYLFRGFFPFWSLVLIAFALVFLAIAVMGLTCYLLGCRRPTAAELYAKDFEQLPNDDEYLLAQDEMNGGPTTMNNGYSSRANGKDFPYDSRSGSIQPTRMVFSNEDAV